MKIIIGDKTSFIIDDDLWKSAKSFPSELMESDGYLFLPQIIFTNDKKEREIRLTEEFIVKALSEKINHLTTPDYETIYHIKKFLGV